jgi:hypothetical protein
VDLSATDRTGFTAVTEPRRAALDIPEILENVLRFLQFKTVFGVQRVCRQWKDLIASSPAIQEKLFLRLRNDTSETWMSMNSKSVPCNIRELPRDSELNFRMVNTVEVESGSWRHTAPGVKHLFKPVALNPLLSRTSTSVFELERGGGHTFKVDVPAAYSPHHSYRDIYLTDPPCRDCTIELEFSKTRPGPNGLTWRGGKATVQSNKALTLGDLIDCALKSRDMYKEVHVRIRHNKRITVEDFFLDKDTSEVGKKHSYRVVFQSIRCGIGLPLDEFTFRPLLLTVKEYLQLQPTETETSSGPSGAVTVLRTKRL